MPPEAFPGRWSEGVPLCWMVCLPQDSHSQPCYCPLHAFGGLSPGDGLMYTPWLSPLWLMLANGRHQEYTRKEEKNKSREFISPTRGLLWGNGCVSSLSPSAGSQHITVWPAELPSSLTSRIFTETTGWELVRAKSKAFCVLGGKKNLRTLSYYSFLFHPQINEEHKIIILDT